MVKHFEPRRKGPKGLWGVEGARCRGRNLVVLVIGGAWGDRLALGGLCVAGRCRKHPGLLHRYEALHLPRHLHLPSGGEG